MTDQRLGRQLELGRVQEERVRLRAAHAPVRADELLERRDLLGDRVDAADQHQIADVRVRLVAQQIGGGPRTVRPQRVGAGTGVPATAGTPTRW